ncbi:MAG: ATP synthase F1 subunit gamma [bacterium]|nr:ATP synthase F1 subunit gamma [bacterium]
MASTLDIRRRIKSVGNTKKITKAMELVAASKMRRAVQQALATRAYAKTAWDVLTNVSAVTNRELHPLLIEREVKRVAVIVVSSDRGLAGGLNTNVVRQTLEVLKVQTVPVDIITVGTKAADALRRLNVNIVAAFPNAHTHPTVADLQPVVKIAIDDYITGVYDKIFVVYTDFRSTLVQKAWSRQVLPIRKQELKEVLDDVDSAISMKEIEGFQNPYLFEPNAEAVLEKMLRNLVTSQLYQVVLESLASEHAARMVAMRNATDSAEELIEDLNLTYNQVRQASITREIAEISAGRAALE